MATNDSSTIFAGLEPGVLMARPSLTVAAVTVVAVVLLSRIVAPAMDAREPQAVKPRIPVIGHLIGMITQSTDYLSTIFGSNRLPVASLPILNGKLYAAFDGAAIQSIYRNKDLSFFPFARAFGGKLMGWPEKFNKIGMETDVLEVLFKAIHEGLSANYVRLMNVAVLKSIAVELEAIKPNQPLEVDNLYLWSRDLFTMSTADAVFGPKNPLRNKEGLVADFWEFESKVHILLMSPWPAITARKAVKARNRVQAELGKYYTAHDDEGPEVSGLARLRAAVLRRYGWVDLALGQAELGLLQASTGNSSIFSYWFGIFIFSRPELAEKLRKEALAIIKGQPDKQVTIPIEDVIAHCPLLSSCYRETLRLVGQSISARKVMEDTTITDGQGQQYILKKGTDVQMPVGVAQYNTEIWGEDAREFDPTRFLDVNKSDEKNKLRRNSFNPFGGGKHLCPGRNFAFAETAGYVITLLLGYEVKPMTGDWATAKLPAMNKVGLASGVCKPKKDGEGFGVRISRRPGWESTTWAYTSGEVEIGL